MWVQISLSSILKLVKLNPPICCTMALRILTAGANSVHIVPSRPSTRYTLLQSPNNRCKIRIANSICLGESTRDRITSLQHCLMGEIGRICARTKSSKEHNVPLVRIHILPSSHSIAPHFFNVGCAQRRRWFYNKKNGSLVFIFILGPIILQVIKASLA